MTFRQGVEVAAVFLFQDIEMHLGTVKFYNSIKGFGFIQPIDGSADIYVHAGVLERAGMVGLAEGQKLEYDLERDQKGRNVAANLRAI